RPCVDDPSRHPVTGAEGARRRRIDVALQEQGYATVAFMAQAPGRGGPCGQKLSGGQRPGGNGPPEGRPVWSPGSWRRRSGQRALHFLALEDVDDVALADVLVVLEGHAGFLTDLDLADLVLEALQRLQRALVDHDIVAQQAHARRAARHALGDLAAGDLAGPGDLEDLQDLGIADEALPDLGREQALGRLLHVVDQVVD